MCWMCNLRKSGILETNQSLAPTVHFQESSRAGAMAGLEGIEAYGTVFQDLGLAEPSYSAFKLLPATGAVRDVTNTILGAYPQPTALDLAAAAAVSDNVPGDASTTFTLTVGGPHVVSTINAPDDTDWFAVQLQAGVTYEFGEYATRFGASGVPLRDAFIELRDANGNRLAQDDSGGPDSNTVDDALLTFTPDVSGLYYVVARSWDTSQAGVDANPLTTNGDYVGDYEVFARVSNLPPPYYEIHYETEDDPATERDETGMPTLDSSPLHAIDWGTQFDGSSRNPDGQEGPRVTGNEVESKIGGKNVIYYYYAREGEVFVDNAANPLNLTTTIVARGWQQFEKNAVDLALDKYEQVADVVYIETDDRWAADMVFVTYNGTPGAGASLLGRMSPPDTPSEGQVEWNAFDERWTQQDLAPGGFYFGTLVHEFGHGHGMAHPHDNGGRSSVMRGVEADVIGGSLGDFDLNQQVFTMMSYNDGWQTSPYGQPDSTDGFGFIGSLMAMDIAVIQDKYGVNEDWATGNDTYVLEDSNHTAEFDSSGNLTREATSYKAIWDAGGTDSIVYNGARDAHIDLRPATLRYEVGGGGWMSYAFGVHGGFTIANSVTIENARGGSGNDVLIGNAANNYLDGGTGTDRIEGGLGNDALIVDGSDIVIEAAGGGFDNVAARGDYTLAAGQEIEVLSTTDHGGTANILLIGNEFGQSIIGNAGNNYIDGGGGADLLQGLSGNDTYIVDADDRILEAVGGGFENVAAKTSFVLNAGAEIEVLSTDNHSGTVAISLTGNAFGQNLIGNAGANYLAGGGGADIFQGLGGDDTMIVDADDRIIEAAGGGHDNVASSTSFTLNPGAWVEVLSTTNHAGTEAINLTGNEQDQSVIGNAGANVLNGGLGIDTLVGYGGADTFAFTTATVNGNIDRIYDFTSGVDRIALDNRIFTGLAEGVLPQAAFRIGAVAVDADDRILYDPTTGHIRFDPDGNGPAAAQHFATHHYVATVGAYVRTVASDFFVFDGSKPNAIAAAIPDKAAAGAPADASAPGPATSGSDLPLAANAIGTPPGDILATDEEGVVAGLAGGDTLVDGLRADPLHRGEEADRFYRAGFSGRDLDPTIGIVPFDTGGNIAAVSHAFAGLPAGAAFLASEFLLM